MKYAALKSTMAAVALGATTALTLAPGTALAAPAGGYVELVKQVAPSVVLIEVTKVTEAVDLRRQMPQGFPFDRFEMPDTDREVSGLGTGFIISEDGQIVTNAHVIDGATEVEVTLPDGRRFEGTVLGADTATDLAVIQITGADNLPVLQFGDSDALEVGQDVVAIGNPFGLGNSVTSGIVSALGRNINSGPFDDFIQTDAAINRGNSGGPLFDSDGNVVGVNTAIFSPSGGSVGIGFAVPSNLVERVVTDLADDGQIERGWLGVRIQRMNDDVAMALGYDTPTGAVIADVTPDTPAQEAGLRRGDIVLSVNGETVADPSDLTRLIASALPGDTVTIDLKRGGQDQTLEITLGLRPSNPT